MLSYDEGENDMFFDTVDCLSSEGLSLAEEELECRKLDYGIWVNEPVSVKKRRDKFLQAMGLTEFVPKEHSSNKIQMDSGGSSIELNRLTECSGAVSSSCIANTSRIVENEGCQGTERSRAIRLSSELQVSEADGHVKRCQIINFDRKRMRSWWKCFVNNRRRDCKFLLEESKQVKETTTEVKIKVQQNNKGCLEFTAPYIGQEIPAHKGFNCTMKFSPDGQYMATGGEDGVVRVWHVLAADFSSNYFAAGGNFYNKIKTGKSIFLGKHSLRASVVFPHKVFLIEESPLHEFRGHCGDVLDLAWSNSNYLISSSKDETVRLWKVGFNQCHGIFQHNNYVTCVQFNPVNENYFISGSIDGKVRIWGLSEKKVVDWADMREVITAVCYQPDGKGFVVGFITGACSFYKLSGEYFMLDKQIHTASRKKATGNKITCIQFSKEKPQLIMISSEDSKLRIFDGVVLIHKSKGLPKSGCQKSASFTSNGRHIISVGEKKRSVKFCEHFFYEDDVSVAETKQWCNSVSSQCSSQTQDHWNANFSIRDSKCFSLSNWFSIDGPCRGSATWPEEQLPSFDLFFPEDQNQYRQRDQNKVHGNPTHSETWGLVIATAGWDGMIRTFHNYGFPTRPIQL